jgi:hypothetical protein
VSSTTYKPGDIPVHVGVRAVVSLEVRRVKLADERLVGIRPLWRRSTANQIVLTLGSRLIRRIVDAADIVVKNKGDAATF